MNECSFNEQIQIRERVTRLESDVTNIKDEIGELRAESKHMNKIIIFLLTIVLGAQSLGLIV